MNLIPGVDASEEMLVLEQVAYQSAMYLPLGETEFTPRCQSVAAMV